MSDFAQTPRKELIMKIKLTPVKTKRIRIFAKIMLRSKKTLLL